MSRGLAGVCVFFVLCGAQGGCASRTRPKAPSLINTRAITQPKTTWPAPGWVARFTAPARLTTCAAFEQSRLCVGEFGERWLEGPAGAIASPYLAPETLVAALPTASHRFIFVGQRGTRYVADTPLGPFTAVQTSAQSFKQYQVTAGRWYGLNARGELWRGAFEDRVGTRLPLAEPLFDFAIAPTGKGLAVSLPERLWWTDDAGEHWRAANVGPFGTTELALDSDGQLRLLALLPAQAPAAQEFRVSDARRAKETEVKLQKQPAVTADVRALEEGRAVFEGKDWFELRLLATGWFVARGHFDEPLSLTKTEGLDDCRALKVAVHAPEVLAVCQTRAAKPGSDALQVRVADPSTMKFTPLAAVQGNFSQVHLAALDANRILATGLCASPAAGATTPSGPKKQLLNAKRVAGCIAQVPVVLTWHRATAPEVPVALAAVTAPGARLAAPPLAVSEDAQSAAFVAREVSGGPWQLYLSTDQGHTFSVHPIDGLPATGAGTAVPSAHMGTSSADTRSVQSLNFGEDRGLGLVMRKGDGPVTYNFDDRGQLIASSLPPPEVSRVDAVGMRILAVSLTQRNVYQSLDRGASFELVGHLPAAACVNYAACPVICRAAGCLIGERFTRVSWGPEETGALDIAGNPEKRELEDELLTERVSFRTPVVCEVQSAGKFTGRGARPPNADQVSIGDLLWYSPWQDFGTASAGMYWVRRGQDTPANARALAPTEFRETSSSGPFAPADAGLGMSFDDAGLVFMRSLRVPKVGEPLGELELASWLFKRPTWVHSRFRDAQALSNSEFYLLGGDQARRLLPVLLSATRDGVFVQTHAEAVSIDEAHWVTPVSATTLDRIPWPLERVREVHWSKVKGSWQVYALDETGSVLLRATKPIAAIDEVAAWTFAARTIANPRFSSLRPEQQVQLRWGEPQPTLFLAHATRGKRLQSVSAQQLTTDAQLLGSSFEVTLPELLSETAIACSARDRRELTRVVLPLLPLAARGVQVLESNQPARWLVATQAVLYSSPKRTCLDALWAESMPGSSAISAVIGLDQLGHATVFRSQPDGLRATSAQCRFDAHATQPPEYETRMQARWNLDHLPLRER
jgi:hypothetical protein